MDKIQAKYLIFDVSPISKPLNYNADFSDTFSWPRMIHLSWIMLDENFKPIKDYDSIIEPEGFSVDDTMAAYAKIELEEIKEKGAPIDDVLTQFAEDIDNSEYVFAHNMNMSEKIVAAEFLRRGISHNFFKADKFCLMQEATYFCGIPGKSGGYKWPSMRELHAACFNQSYTPSGNARADVIAAARCFIKLMKTGQLEDLFDED